MIIIMNIKTVFMFMLFAIIIISLNSCKKDYAKLSTEFVRNLPDSCELLLKIDTDLEHLVYYKSKEVKAFYCHNLETQITETINVEVSDRMNVKDIMAGKDHIMVSASKWDDDYHQSAEIHLYNLDTQKFEKLEDCSYFENNPAANTIKCVSVMEMPRLYTAYEVIKVYDYDGNLISEEEKEQEEEAQSDVFDDDDYSSQDKSPQQVFYCDICKQRVMASEKFEADIKASKCKARYEYNSQGDRIYVDGHEWQYIQY